MLKTRIFYVNMLYDQKRKNIADFELEINQWLEENQNIEIVSANCPAEIVGYIILYKEIQFY